jgi:BASS family bile acid:Na+ symporter
MLKWIKNWTLPLSILTGALAHPWLWQLGDTLPYLIFAMLLLAFSSLSPRSIRLRPAHGWLLLAQTGGATAVYFLLLPFNTTLAQGAMITVLAPTAATSAVVTSLLGGNMGFLTTYMLLSYLALALLAPPLFSLVAPGVASSPSFLLVCLRVIPVVIFPLLLAWALRRFCPKLHRQLSTLHQLSFYIWAFSLIIVTAQTLHILLQPPPLAYPIPPLSGMHPLPPCIPLGMHRSVETSLPHPTLLLLLASLSFLFCIGQFLLGRYIGRLSGDPISAGQGLGQKNTILAIWLAQTYLAPLSFVAPAAYVLWQTLINALQLHRHKKNSPPS